MTTAHAIIGPKIELGTDFIRVIDLIVQNQVLSQILSEKPIEEQIMTLETILKLGAETYRLFGTTAANESIEKVGEKIATEISGKGEALIKDVKDIAAQMVANSGELSVRATLDIWRTEFSKMLELKFDPENKASILSQFDDLIKKKSQDQNAEIMNRLDFNVPTSAINMLQKNLNDHVTSQLGELGLKVDEINKSLAKDEQAKIDKRAQASRGIDFEADLFEIVASFAHLKSDIADNPGAQKLSGLAGNHEGDITVQVSPKETHGEIVGFVWEGKLRQGTISIKQCMEELQKGITNRGSQVGIIAVENVSGLSTQTGDVFKEINDNMAVLVLDPNDIDENAVHLAYLWARWKCLMNLGTSLDTALVVNGISSIKQAMKSIATMRTNNTEVLKAIDRNNGLFADLEDNITAELEKLSKAIDEVNAEKSAQLDQ
jgi:hypothetical protein